MPLSSVLAKRKRDDNARVSGHKKSSAPLSLRALRQLVGLMPSLSHPSSLQDVPSTPIAIKAPTFTVVVIIVYTPAPPPTPIIHVQEATPTSGVSASAT